MPTWCQSDIPLPSHGKRRNLHVLDAHRFASVPVTSRERERASERVRAEYVYDERFGEERRENNRQ